MDVINVLIKDEFGDGIKDEYDDTVENGKSSGNKGEHDETIEVGLIFNRTYRTFSNHWLELNIMD